MNDHFPDALVADRTQVEYLAACNKKRLARGVRAVLSAVLLAGVLAAGMVGCGGASFTSNGTPSVTQLTPSSGPIATAVVVSGSNFGASQSAANGTVKFNGTPAPVISWSRTAIVVAVPVGAATGNVVVTTNSTSTAGTPFTVSPGAISTCQLDATRNATFLGTYAYLMGGFTGPGLVGTHLARVGSITIASGLITGGEEDLNVGTSTEVHHTINTALSTFKVGPDNRGCMTLTFSDATAVTFRFSIGSFTGANGTATRGHIIEFDDAAGTGNRASGILLQQTISAFVPTALQANYAFGLQGFDSSHAHVSVSGTFTLAPTTLANNITNGSLDENDGGTLPFLAAGTAGTTTGTLATEPAGTISATSGRTTATIIAEPACAATCTTHYAVYIIDANQAFLMSSDTLAANTPLVAGRAIATFAPGNTSLLATAFAGEQTGSLGFILEGTGAIASVAKVEVGQIIFAAGGTSMSTLDTYSLSTPATSSPNGNYSIAANGRLTFTSGAVNFVMYLTNPTVGDNIAAFATSTQNGAIGGQLITQGSGAFSPGGDGNFFFGTINMGDNTVDNLTAAIGAQVSSGGSSDKLSGAQDTSGPVGDGLSSSTFGPTQFTMTASGSITATDGVNPIVGWADGNAAFIVDESGAGAIIVIQK